MQEILADIDIIIRSLQFVMHLPKLGPLFVSPDLVQSVQGSVRPSPTDGLENNQLWRGPSKVVYTVNILRVGRSLRRAVSIICLAVLCSAHNLYDSILYAYYGCPGSWSETFQSDTVLEMYIACPGLRLV